MANACDARCGRWAYGATSASKEAPPRKQDQTLPRRTVRAANSLTRCLLALHVTPRKAVGDIKGERSLLPRPRRALHAKLQFPRLGGIQGKIFRDREQSDFLEGWRAFSL